MDLEKQNHKSVTMEYFLETTHLDAATADMLRKYDKSGSGSFSKDEVVSIILDLRATLRKNEILGNSNKLFKRLLLGSIVFIVLLLGSMFGLSYAVAALTANTEVQSDGTLLAKGSNMPISTDSRADVHDVTSVDSTYCMLGEEVTAIKNEVLAGKNVLLQLSDADNNSESLEQLFASGAAFTDTSACFWMADKGKHACFKKLEAGATCTPRGESGRRLGRIKSLDANTFGCMTAQAASGNDSLGCLDEGLWQYYES